MRVTENLPVQQKRHESLKILLNRRGIKDASKDTAEGQLIQHMLDEFAESGNKKLAPSVRYALAELIVSSILLARSSMTYMIAARAPSSSPSEAGKSKRQAFQIAGSTFSKASTVIIQGVKALGAADTGDAVPKALNQVLADIIAEKAATSIPPDEKS